MKTIIFATAIRLLTPLFLLFSVYILLRGHNHPGGGFIGGLIGSIAFVFHVLAYGASGTISSFFTFTLYRRQRQPPTSRTRYCLQIIRANILGRKQTNARADWHHVTVRLRPTYLLAIGLLVAVSSGTLSLFYRQPYMTGRWLEAAIPVIGALGTPILFDTGVYLLVLGMVLKIVFTISKD